MGRVARLARRSVDGLTARFPGMQRGGPGRNPRHPPPGRKRPGAADPGLYVSIAASAVMALAGALITVAFVWVLRQVHTLLWEELPGALGFNAESLPLVFVVAMCTVGGALVGVCRHYLGEYPVSLERAVDEFRNTRSFDYQHIPQAIVASLVALGFGAALGPEAALVAVVGGLSSLLAHRIHANAEHATAVGYLGVSGALGAVFGPGVAAVPIEEVAESGGAAERDQRLWLVLPGIAAAAVGWFVLRSIDGVSNYFAFNWPTYDFAPVDLVWALVATAVAVLAVVVFSAVGQAIDVALEGIAANKILVSTIGGVGLGLLGAWSSLMLFSGHEGIQLVMDDATITTGFALALVGGKVLATSLCLSTGWKGGRFFPMMFVGAAVGMAVASISESAVTPVVAAGMSACVAALLRKPIPALVFMALVLPSSAWIFAAVGCLAGGVAATRLFERLDTDPAAGDEDADGAAARSDDAGGGDDVGSDDANGGDEAEPGEAEPTS